MEDLNFENSSEYVSDFRTAITGIRPEDLYTGMLVTSLRVKPIHSRLPVGFAAASPFLKVRADVAAFVKDKIMIGHSLWEDLAVSSII